MRIEKSHEIFVPSNRAFNERILLHDARYCDRRSTQRRQTSSRRRLPRDAATVSVAGARYSWPRLIYNRVFPHVSDRYEKQQARVSVVKHSPSPPSQARNELSAFCMNRRRPPPPPNCDLISPLMGLKLGPLAAYHRLC